MHHWEFCILLVIICLKVGKRRQNSTQGSCKVHNFTHVSFSTSFHRGAAAGVFLPPWDTLSFGLFPAAALLFDLLKHHSGTHSSDFSWGGGRPSFSSGLQLPPYQWVDPQQPGIAMIFLPHPSLLNKQEKENLRDLPFTLFPSTRIRSPPSFR